MEKAEKKKNSNCPIVKDSIMEAPSTKKKKNHGSTLLLIFELAAFTQLCFFSKGIWLLAAN